MQISTHRYCMYIRSDLNIKERLVGLIKLTHETDWLTADRRLRSQLAVRHTHTYTVIQLQHAHTRSSSALLCLFPLLHTHVLCVSITAWYRVFLSSVRQGFLSLYFSPVPFSCSSSPSPIFPRCLWILFCLPRCHIHSCSLTISVFLCLLDSDSWPCINLFLVTSVSPSLFLSLSLALRPPFNFAPFLPPPPPWLSPPNLASHLPS